MNALSSARSARGLRRTRTMTAIAGTLGVALLVTACGSSSDSGDDSPAAVDAPVAYEGPESGLPDTYPKPEVKARVSFKVGYLSPSDAIPGLKATKEAARKEVEALGGSFIGKDALTDPQKQVTQMNDLIAQHVDVIVGYPLNPQSWTASIAKAKTAGVPVIVMSTPWDLSQKAFPGVTANVSQGFDHQAYGTAKAVAAKHPGAKFAVLNTALPIPALKYLGSRQEYWGKRFGLEFVGKEDAQSDTPAAAADTTTTILTKHPDVKVIFAYSDTTGVAAANLSKGKDVVVAAANGGEKVGIASIEAGVLGYSYAVPWARIGQQMVDAAYLTLTKQGGTPVPEIIITGKVLDSSNADDADGV